jgi:hypothetical protein
LRSFRLVCEASALMTLCLFGRKKKMAWWTNSRRLLPKELWRPGRLDVVDGTEQTHVQPCRIIAGASDADHRARGETVVRRRVQAPRDTRILSLLGLIFHSQGCTTGFM